MSNEKMREEFEAWVVPYSKERLYSYQDLVLKRSSDGYATTWVDSMWIGWQASRAAIEVELPSCRDSSSAYFGDECYDPDELVKAIESLGLKVKP